MRGAGTSASERDATASAKRASEKDETVGSVSRETIAAERDACDSAFAGGAAGGTAFMRTGGAAGGAGVASAFACGVVGSAGAGMRGAGEAA